MGLYDRTYYHEEEPRRLNFGSGQRAMIVNLIIVNAVIFLISEFLTGKRLTGILAVRPETISQPWMWWQFLTYGFAHADVFHLLGNMFGLYFLGMELEAMLGSRRFLSMYLTCLVLCSVVWASTEQLLGHQASLLIGASGAVTAVVILFALNFPKRTVLFMMFIPMPAWVLGVFIVFFNLMGNHGTLGQTRVAYDVHLVGAAYGAIFHMTRWDVTKLWPANWKSGTSNWSWKKLKPSPKLRLHDPDRRTRKLDEEADVILAKLHREGEASLSNRERKILEEYSRRLQRKRDA